MGDRNFALSLGAWFMGQAEKVIGPDEQDSPLRAHHFKAPRCQQPLVGDLCHPFIVAPIAAQQLKRQIRVA